MNNICEYSGLPNTQSYTTNSQTHTEGAGVGGESFKENFIDCEFGSFFIFWYTGQSCFSK